jgi:hypothetical protein
MNVPTHTQASVHHLFGWLVTDAYYRGSGSPATSASASGVRTYSTLRATAFGR